MGRINTDYEKRYDVWYRTMIDNMQIYQQKVLAQIAHTYTKGLQCIKLENGKQKQILQLAWKYERSICVFNLLSDVETLRAMCDDVMQGEAPPNAKQQILCFLQKLRTPKLPSMELVQKNK